MLQHHGVSFVPRIEMDGSQHQRPIPSPLVSRACEATKAQLVVRLSEVVARCIEARVEVDAKVEAMLRELIELREAPSASTSDEETVGSEESNDVLESMEARDEEDEWEDDKDCGYSLVAVTAAEFERLNGGPPVPRRRRSFVDDGGGVDDLSDEERHRRKQVALLAAAPRSLRTTVDRLSLRPPSGIPRNDFFLGSLELRVVFDQLRTGFEDSKDLVAGAGVVIGGRYEIQGLIGRAAFSTTYAAKDLWGAARGANKVPDACCLKVIKNSKDFFDQSLDEIKLLRYLSESGDVDTHRIVRLLDALYYKEHLVVVSELLGENLYEYGKRVRESSDGRRVAFPERLMRRVARDCLRALAYVHSLGMIHCDVKPENVVLARRGDEIDDDDDDDDAPAVKLVDFGSSCFWSDKLSTYVQSRSYRAPEVVLGLGYDAAIDLWSLGCVLAEIRAGYVLFQNDSVATMLARIIAVLGRIPDHMLAAAPCAPNYFCARAGNVYERFDAAQPRPPAFRRSSRRVDATRRPNDDLFFLIFPKKTSLKNRLHLPRTSPFLDFVHSLLSIDPSRRPAATVALRHSWCANTTNLVSTMNNSGGLRRASGSSTISEHYIRRPSGSSTISENDDDLPSRRPVRGLLPSRT